MTDKEDFIKKLSEFLPMTDYYEVSDFKSFDFGGNLAGGYGYIITNKISYKLAESGQSYQISDADKEMFSTKMLYALSEFNKKYGVEGFKAGLVDPNIPGSRDFIGDLNKDNLVNSKDILILKQFIVSEIGDMRIVYHNADVNLDGDIGLKDILRMKKYFAGILEYEYKDEHYDPTNP